MRRELLLREMRDAAVAIRDLAAGRDAEEIDADVLRRSALLWHFTVLGEAASQVPVDTKDAQLRSRGARQPVSATASSTATWVSMSTPWSRRLSMTSLGSSGNSRMPSPPCTAPKTKARLPDAGSPLKGAGASCRAGRLGLRAPRQASCERAQPARGPNALIAVQIRALDQALD